ncbi:MAG: OstA-like protein [Chitinophagaceae bacterium]|nr:OstA-like protein [Chitinophagaceae bacterium]
MCRKPGFYFLLLFFSCTDFLYAQQPANSGIKDTSRIINLIRSDKYKLIKQDSAGEIHLLVGKVVMKQDKTTFECDSAIHNTALNQIEAFGNVHINDADSVHTHSQYLKYLGNTKIAYLNKKVRLTDGKADLTTEELEYDLNAKIGTYKNGGKVVNGSSVLTSKEGYYYADTREVYFKDTVKLVDPEYTLATDTLLYNINSEIATFVAATTINDGTSTIRTRSGFYDLKEGKANFGNRPVINDSTQEIIADNINYDKKSGEAHAEGNVFYRDTAQGVTILAGDTWVNNQTKKVLATKKPVMIIKQDNDSLYVAADTLFSATYIDSIVTGSLQTIQADSAVKIKTDSMAVNLTRPGRGLLANTVVPAIKKTDSSEIAKTDSAIKLQTDTLAAAIKETAKDTLKNITVIDPRKKDSIRYFEAFHHVKIFSDSLQGVCDSLYYTAKDSVFRMFRDPVMWAKGSQVSGDTIYLFTKNKKADQVFVFENGFAINKTPEDFFNQLRGNRMNGYFKDGEIDYMRAKGNAESFYYLQEEDSSYFGANYARADAISMYFAEKELIKVTWVNGVEGTTYPMGQVPGEKKQLRNFKWLEDRRPKTRLELFGE